jgi:hypothetical protein
MDGKQGIDRRDVDGYRRAFGHVPISAEENLIDANPVGGD